MRSIAALAVALCLLAAPAAAQLPDPATQAFMQQLQPGATLADYTERLRQEFRQLDADSDGVLTAADADLHDAVAKAQVRAMGAMQFLRFDLDHDGAVTADEVRRMLRYEQRNQVRPNAGQSSEAEVARVMAADKNGDGKVTLAEAMDAASAQKRLQYDVRPVGARPGQRHALAQPRHPSSPNSRRSAPSASTPSIPTTTGRSRRMSSTRTGAARPRKRGARLPRRRGAGRGARREGAGRMRRAQGL